MASIMEKMMERSIRTAKYAKSIKAAGGFDAPLGRVYERAAQAAKTRDKRVAKRMQHVKNASEMMIRKRNEAIRKQWTKLFKAARKRRKDEWERGPLAARPDVGKDEKLYGSIPGHISIAPVEYEARRPDWFSIREGDRAVVTMGGYKGRIAEVTKLDEETCHVELKGININVSVPEYMQERSGGQQVVTVPMNIPYKHIKLVWAMVDPRTGAARDVIIDKLEAVGRKKDHTTGKLDKGERRIPGTNTIIPWMSEADIEREVYPDDTTADLVDLQTYQPRLTTEPMPRSVIDELRGKFSPFRTRFSFEERQKTLDAAEAANRRKGLIRTMQTPLQQLAELRAQQKREREMDLTPDQLAAIGRVMAEEQAKRVANGATL